NSSGTTYYASHDHQGNLVGLLSPSGVFDAWYEYDAFGNVIQSGGAKAASNPIGFSGQYTDRETGFVNYGLRYYSPELGRFVTRDPIGEAGGQNLYRFANNNPVNAVDVHGTWFWEFVGRLVYNLIVGEVVDAIRGGGR